MGIGMCFAPLRARGQETGNDLSDKIILLYGVDLMKTARRPHIAKKYEINLFCMISDEINEPVELLIWIPFSSKSSEAGGNDHSKADRVINWCLDQSEHSLEEPDDDVISVYNWDPEIPDYLPDCSEGQIGVATESNSGIEKMVEYIQSLRAESDSDREKMVEYIQSLREIPFSENIEVRSESIENSYNQVLYKAEVSGTLTKCSIFHLYVDMEGVRGWKDPYRARARDCQAGAPFLFYFENQENTPEIVETWVEDIEKIPAIILQIFFLTHYKFDDSKFINGMIPRFNKIQFQIEGKTDTPVGEVADGRWTTIFAPHSVDVIADFKEGKWALKTCFMKQVVTTLKIIATLLIATGGIFAFFNFLANLGLISL